MRRHLVLVAALAFALGVTAGGAMADEGAVTGGMLGKRHLSLTVGQLVPGDDIQRDKDDTILNLGANLNYPLHQNIDAFAAIAYTQMKGGLDAEDFTEIVTKSAMVGALYHFFPGKAFDPFAKASLGWIQTDELGADLRDDYTLRVGGGVEVPFAGQFAARPAVEYRQVDKADDVFGMLDVNGWFNEVLFVGLGAAYGLDQGDFIYSGSIGFSF